MQRAGDSGGVQSSQAWGRRPGVCRGSPQIGGRRRYQKWDGYDTPALYLRHSDGKLVSENKATMCLTGYTRYGEVRANRHASADTDFSSFETH